MLENLPENLKKKARPTVEALLNIIPFAGGSLSSIINNYYSERKTEKIIDAIEELEKTVRINETVMEKLLTEDQVCELLEKHLTEIGISSDEEKIKYLKNSLKKSFTSEEYKFEEKEWYLSVLKGMTSNEIVMLKEIYFSDDPFVQTVYPPSQSHLRSYPLTADLRESYFIPTKKYVEEGRSYKSGGITFNLHFQNKYKKQWELLKGACILLDSKGLANTKDNFDNNTFKEIAMKEVYENPAVRDAFGGLMVTGGSISPLVRVTQVPIFEKEKQKTPIEASKTNLGEAFIKYIMY